MSQSGEPQLPQRSFREMAANAVRFWERARILYNLVLLLIVGGYAAATFPESLRVLTVDAVLGLFVLAVLANIAFCAAYPIDIFMQFTGFDEIWRYGRWIVFGVGVAFAATLAYFMMGGLFFPVPAQDMP